MLKLSVTKDLFEEVLTKKISILKKESSKYWKNELFEPKIKNDKLIYDVKQVKKVIITNGLGNLKPQLTIECNKISYCTEKKCFEFHLGKILEQKNLNDTFEEKEKFIEQLVEENNQLKEKMKLVQQKMEF